MISWGTDAEAEPEADVRALGSPNVHVKEMELKPGMSRPLGVICF